MPEAVARLGGGGLWVGAAQEPLVERVRAEDTGLHLESWLGHLCMRSFLARVPSDHAFTYSFSHSFTHPLIHLFSLSH